MRAVAFAKPLPVTDPDALVDIEIETPSPGPRDLLVKVEAVSWSRAGRGYGFAEGRAAPLDMFV